ncbi:extracellular solute-binding protein, partial [Pseudomonas sp. BGM005]|nr:extracellular solute-binding protein [Pseudomonas sp. BG5]
MKEADSMNAPASRRATRLVLTGVAGLAAAALAGCAGSPAGGSGGDAGGPLVLYTWAASEGDQAQWADFIDGAKAEDPDLDITVEGPSFSDYWTKVKTRLSGSNPPCLLTTQAARAQELGDLLMPLDDLIEKSGFDIDNIDASMLSGMTVD